MILNNFQPMPASKMRYRALDGYRFVAAVCVVLYHYNHDFQLGLERLSPAVLGFDTTVDFFFLLSGFVITVGYLNRMTGLQDYCRFLRARLARIYPLHALTAAAFVGLLAVSTIANIPSNHQEVFRLSALPAHLVMVQAWGFVNHPSLNVPSWSISSEWLVYLLVPFFFALSRRISFLGNLSLTVGFIALMVVIRRSAGLPPWTSATHDFGAFRAIPTFFVGVLIAANLSRVPASFTLPWWCVHAMFVSALIMLHLEARREIAIAAFAILIFTAALAERSGRPTFMAGQMMNRLGDASYSVYMLHELMSIPVLFVLRHWGLLGTPVAEAIALLTLASTVLLSIQVHSRFEAPLRLCLAGR